MKINQVLQLIPKQWKEHFELELVRGDKPYFVIDRREDKIVIMGDDLVSLASGYYHYLKNCCGISITWNNPYVHTLDRPPIPKATIKKESPYLYRYAYNYCTFNYSMTWWDEERWMREIDWLALHGYNMPLAITGHEKVVLNTWKRLGMSTSSVKEYLTGPAFYAWNYMGNLDGIGGPVPDSWIEGQSALQLKILNKQRGFGMKPVLMGFYGHVPMALKELYPEANIQRLKPWFDAEGIYFLDPLDPLFREVAKIFYEEQRKLYGNDHFYSMDLFHEGSSPDDSDEYLISRTKAVYEAMKEFDSQGKWVMQAWTYREKVADAIPDEDMIILDLYADEHPKWEKTNGFNGKPFVWCMLHNFGGRPGIFGHLENINKGPIKALESLHGGKMMGIGMAPEAIEENEIFYELLSTMMWEDEEIQLETWLTTFITCRYGRVTKNLLEAWKILLKTAYAGVNPNGGTESILCARPSVELTKVCNGSLEHYCDIEELVPVIQLLLKERHILGARDAFRYDVINISREVLAIRLNESYRRLMEIYRNKDINGVKAVFATMKKSFYTLEELLGCHKSFRLDTWLEEAKAWGESDEEKELYEINGKMQISRWWPDVNFLDYAHKQWHGMIKECYEPRWQSFYELLLKSLREEKFLTRDHVTKEMIRIEEAFYEGESYTSDYVEKDAYAIVESVFNEENFE